MIVVAEHSIKAVTTIEAKRNLEGDVTKVLYTLGRQLSTTGEGGWDATSPTYPGSILQRLSCPLASCMDIPVAADGTLLSSGQIEKEPLLLPTGDVATYRTVLEYFSERLQSVGQVVNLEVKEEPDRRLKVKITFPKAPGAPNQLGLRITVKDETVDSQKGDALLRRGTRARVQEISIVPYISHALEAEDDKAYYLPCIRFRMNAWGSLIDNAVQAMIEGRDMTTFINGQGENSARLMTYWDEVGYPPGWLGEKGVNAPIFDSDPLKNSDYFFLMNGIRTLAAFVKQQNR